MGLGVGSEKTLRGGEVHAGFGRQRPKRACTHMCLCVHVCLTYPQSPITVLAAAQMANPSPSTICSLYLPHLGLVQTESGEVTMGPREQARRAFRQAGLSPCDFRGQDPGPLSTQLRGLGGKSLPNWSLGFRAGILTGLAESGSSTRGGGVVGSNSHSHGLSTRRFCGWWAQDLLHSQPGGRLRPKSSLHTCGSTKLSKSLKTFESPELGCERWRNGYPLRDWVWFLSMETRARELKSCM